MTLREFRKSKGWTLHQMAARLQTTAASLSRLETGKQEPSYGLLMRIRKISKGEIDETTFARAA